MGISLAYLKKVLKFGILLVGIQFAGLQRGLGAYSPSSLKRYYSLPIDYFYTERSWLNINLNISDAAIGQCIVPSAMVDTKGNLYTVHLVNFDGFKGAHFSVQKRAYGAGYDSRCEIYPWDLVGNVNYCSILYFNYIESDYPSAEDIFKNYIHNAFQPCIAQEVEASNYLYVYFYVPPAFFFEKNYNNAGILIVKLNKSDLSIVSHEFKSSNNDSIFDLHYLRPRTISGMALGPEWGNFQGWVDGDRTRLCWQCGDCDPNLGVEKHAMSPALFGFWGNDNSIYAFGINSPVIGTSSFSRFLKVNGNVYTVNHYNSSCVISNYLQGELSYPNTLVMENTYISHLNSDKYTVRHYDFCIVDNKDKKGPPIFCVLGLRPTSETDSSKTSLSGATNKRWTSEYINEPSKIVLMLSSYAWDGNSSSSGKIVPQADIAEDPQNIIYSTEQTAFTKNSCSVHCGCYPSGYDGYGENQLFKNTHKLVTYTSESGSKYIIYCYCYPGKSKQLFLGYAPYIISNNKVHLLTKTEFKTPPSTDYPMGESFGYFTSCSRIISMDCKNGKLWITWMDKDDMYYYCFHVAAKDLVGE